MSKKKKLVGVRSKIDPFLIAKILKHSLRSLPYLVLFNY